MISSIKIGQWLFQVSAHTTHSHQDYSIHVPNVLWEAYCSKWHSCASWNVQISSAKTVQFKKLSCSVICSNMCATVSELSYLPCAASFWTTCNLCGIGCRLSWRILWRVLCGICNSVLAQEISFFGPHKEAYLTKFIFSSDLLGHPVQCLFSTLLVCLNKSYHLLMCLSSSGFTTYPCLNSCWTLIWFQILCTTTWSVLSAIQ
jgi:hypothetical protein